MLVYTYNSVSKVCVVQSQYFQILSFFYDIYFKLNCHVCFAFIQHDIKHMGLCAQSFWNEISFKVHYNARREKNCLLTKIFPHFKANSGSSIAIS